MWDIASKTSPLCDCALGAHYRSAVLETAASLDEAQNLWGREGRNVTLGNFRKDLNRALVEGPSHLT
jgi:hypothetical protein